MGFFDSLSDLVLGSNSDIKDLAGQADLNLGNIFLPGGLKGGASNTTAPGAMGFGGSPLNEADYNWASQNWQKFRGPNAGHLGQGEYAWWNDPSQTEGLSAEGKKYLETTLGGAGIGGAANFSDINWNTVTPKFGTPGYAAPAGAPGAAGGATGTSPLGDLEPARGMFANIAATGNVGQNSQGDILKLLREQANPFEQKAFQDINQNLFSRGRLGAEDSATGEAYQGFARGLSEADTGRQLAAYGLSDQLQTSQLGRMLGGAQGASGLTNLSTLPFDMALKLAMAKSGAAVNQGNLMKAGQGDSLVDAWSKFWSFG